MNQPATGRPTTAPAETTLQAAMNDYWTERSGPYDDYQNRPERREADVALWREIWGGALGEGPLDVLDVGTGSGHVARVVAGLGHRVTGIDLAAGMLERARAHALTDAHPPVFAEGDAVAPPYADGSFDAIVNRYVMWTLREPAVALANWARLLRPGGRLAVVDATWFTGGLHSGATERFEAAYGHAGEALPLAEAQSIEATADVVRAAGFADVTVTPLESVYALDEEYGVAPGHELLMQYLVTARRA